MNEHRRIYIAFLKLGDFLRDFTAGEHPEGLWSQKLSDTIALAGHKNGWFTEENVTFALKAWGELLRDASLGDWLGNYSIKVNAELETTETRSDKMPKTIAVIMAGNIPLVGFHDLLCVLITGNRALIKFSSNDNVLISFIKDYLVSIEPLFQNRIHVSEGKLEDFDAVIATGSNNTSRYFHYYFGKVPNIIRKHRNSTAVLTGNESGSQLAALGEDIFRYYGLGCRSVSKLFVPEKYDFDTFFKSIIDYGEIVEQQKYANNYDYNKAVYLMSDFRILDNGFLVLKEDEGYASPIASLFYERYASLDTVRRRLKEDADQLQCVVADGVLDNEIYFGETQTPSLSDYADGVDTVDFVLRT